MSEENEFLFFKNETQYVHVLRNYKFEYKYLWKKDASHS